MYPRGIFGHRMEVFEYHPSVGWTGSDVWWARVAGERLELGGSTSYLAHTDAVGSMVMETDQTGAVTYDVRRVARIRTVPHLRSAKLSGVRMAGR